MQKFEFSYNSKEDDLFIFRKGAKSAGSVEIGPVVLDMDEEGQLVAIEFMNAKEYLSSATETDVSSMGLLLEHLEECKVDVKVWRNALLTIKLLLVSGKKEAVWNFSLPQVTEASPVSSF
jgi:uncharacterized protein YuzE